MDGRQELKLWSYSEPTYENFIGFVREYLAPCMTQRFVEEDYYRLLWEAMWEHRKVDAQVSRGHSKSELLAIWATIYIAVYQPYNPFYEKAFGEKKRIYEQLVFSSDDRATGELNGRIDDYFRGSDVLVQFMPEGKDPDKWNQTKFELNNGSVIHFRGSKMKRGLHIDRAVGDDLTTESSTLTDDATWDFFAGAFLPMTTAKQGMIMIDGTPIRATDIMSKLEKEQGWHHIKLPAITDWEKKELLSPNRFTWETLMDIRTDQGSVKFEAEYMLNPIDDTTALIKREWVRQCFDEHHDIKRHRHYFESTFLGVDFAFSDRKEADWSVMVVLGQHEGELFLLDVIRNKGLSGLEQLDLVRELHAVYKFDMIGLEENSIRAIIPQVRDLRLPIKLFRTGTVDERDKRKPDFSGVVSVSKRNLVLRIGTTFENGGIVLPYASREAREKMDRLVEECVSWALDGGKLIELGVHPDIPIALGYALEVGTKTSFVFEFV